MAYKELHKIREHAISSMQVSDMIIQHRVGIVPKMEESVVIVAISPHRKEAIKAVEWAIDELKAKVPIWKKEIDKGDKQDP